MATTKSKPKERIAIALERIATTTEAMQRELLSIRLFIEALWKKRP